MTFLLLALSLLLPLSLLPPALLQYLAFASQLKKRQKHLVLTGYTLIFCAEYGISFYLTFHAHITHSLPNYVRFYLFAWLPYFLWAVLTIRHRFFRHFFLLIVRTIFMMALHTTLLAVIWLFNPQLAHPASPISWASLLHLTLYTLCYLAALRPLGHFFNELFHTYNELGTPVFWRNACFLPFLLLANNLFFVIDNLTKEDYWLVVAPRFISLLAIILILLSIRSSLRSAHEALLNRHHQAALTMQIKNSRRYITTLQESQQEMQAFCQKRRRYFRTLTNLLTKKKYTAALAYIKNIGADLNRTKRKQYCKNTILNAALAIYLGRAETLQIPVTTRIDLPPENLAMTTNLAIVLSNLIENAVQASEKQPATQRALVVRAITQGDMVNILVKNRFDGQVTFAENGLPLSQHQQEGHGLGMQSLRHFQTQYDANLLCSYEDGWFATYIRVRYA